MRQSTKWGRGDKRDCAALLCDLLTKRRGYTAYELARKSGYTPQHVNRTLKKMWAFGRCAYHVVPYRSGEKRVWGSIEYKDQTEGVYPWEYAMERLI